ncbi:Dual specificity phosphatase, catalytic domain family protein [Leishmania donovani]|uniref:protein-tyrosine-phosphatase n=2 Tax=Leishmania donovani TaxID=5661 RepID=A0A504XNV2_LEIDO|nr:Dual specificity phosphatase, catalytic domain family protein [Leishmania donovani]
MQRSGGGGSAAGVSVRETSSPRSTPELPPNSFRGGLNFGDFPEHTGSSGGNASVRRSLSTSPAPSPARRPSCSAEEAAKGSIHRTRKKKKGRPQNALFMLANSMGGGATPATAGSQVVDLRALDPSPCPSRGSRSPLRSCHVHERGSRCEDVPATQILEFLYLGSVKDAQDAAFLARHQIRYIINVSQEEYWSVDKKVQIFTFKVDDSATADIAALFQPTRDLINSIRGRYYRYARGESSTRPAVLVHCQKGRSRSATIVLAYLIYTNGWSVAEAMKYVGARRPCAEPNIGFMEELRKLQESLSFEERTRRYSELCWFMRNLNAETSQSHVRELFEKRIGMVRHVVTYVVAGGGAGNVADGGTAGNCGDGSRVTVQRDTRFSASWPAAPSTGDSDAADSLVAFDLGAALGKQNDGLDDQRAAKDSDTHAYKDASAAVSLLRGPSTEKTMLCFVFFTCREDVLHGIKSGQFQQLLLQLPSAAGKQIKYATGPKLKKIMTEHQSMSSSFVQDMAGFSDHATTRTGGESAAADADGAVQTQGVVAPASKEADVTRPV